MTKEERYILAELKAEFVEGVFAKNWTDLENKHSIGRQLLACPSLRGKVCVEDHYYVKFVEMFPELEDVDKLGLGKIVSWAKVKNHIKQMKDIRVRKGKENATKLLENPGLFTEKQSKYLKMRAEGMTLQQIADEEGTTRQAVSDSITSASKRVSL